MLPYLFADYGRFFARVDTFGIKMLPIGNGYLELVGRVSQDGWNANIAPQVARLLSDKQPAGGAQDPGQGVCWLVVPV